MDVALERVVRDDELLADRAAGAAHFHDYEAAFENRQALINVRGHRAVIDERFRQTSIDPLRPDGLPAAGELRDVVLRQFLPLALRKRNRDRAAEWCRIDLR